MSADPEVHNAGAKDLINELWDEVKELQKIRHVKFDRGLIAILRQQNDKYKAIVRLFEKDMKLSPIREDGFEFICEKTLPGIREKMTSRASRIK